MEAQYMFSLPPNLRHSAKVIASSIACVAPLPDVGKNGWHASPSWAIRPDLLVHTGWGLRHINFQSMTSLGVWRMKSMIAGSQSPLAEIKSIAFCGLMRLFQDSVALPSSYNPAVRCLILCSMIGITNRVGECP